MPNTLIILPTYNEKENIELLVSEIFRHAADANILIVDDNSTDGTAGIIDNIANKDNRVSVMHRFHDRGRGAAGMEAFRKAVSRNGIDYVVEMDADFSHDPRYIPLFLEEIKSADIVVGSRFVKGGKDTERGSVRVILSKLANLFIRRYLSISVKDCSSGYRCFRMGVLSSLELDKMVSKGPSAVEEILYECSLKKYRIKEIPIIFKNRKAGKTKLGFIKLMAVLIDIVRFKNRKSSHALSRELRGFGFNLGLGLTVAGFLMFLRHRGYFVWFSAGGSLVIIAAILSPVLLRPVKKILDGVIFSFGRLVGFISSAAAFYLIFTPTGIVFRLLGVDLLHQKIDRKSASYWLSKETGKQSKEKYEQMG